MQRKTNNICKDENVFEAFFQRWGKKYVIHESIFKWYCLEFAMYPLTQSKFQNRLRLLSQIYTSNQSPTFENFKNILRDYHNNQHNRAKQLDIRYGIGSGQSFKDKLSEKTKTKIHIGTIQYWMNKGLSETEALRAKTKYYNELNKKGTSASLNKLKSNPTLKLKKYNQTSKTKKERKNILYWLDKGLTLEQATDQIAKYFPPKRSIQNYINKYGPIEGPIKHKESYIRQIKTTQDRYGTNIKRGYTSKSSIKYFIKLYKALRRNGIQKEDVCWGIGSNREFTTRDVELNKNYAFDFVIKSKRIIIEYNDPFWHARDPKEWKNPMVSYEDSYERDSRKKIIAEKIGFEIIYVWSDNLMDINELKNKILTHE